MSNVFVTSDLHLGHDKEFIWRSRGFNSVKEMNEAIVTRWNAVVPHEGLVYVLGDIMLGNNEAEIKLFNQLNGEKIIILGNHDSKNRIELYQECGYETDWAKVIKYNGYTFYLSHYPTLCSNLDDAKKGLKGRVINLCGHSHVINPYADEDKGLIYHVEVDAHNCYPVNLDDVILDIRNTYNL